MNDLWREQVILNGKTVRLEPLSEVHIHELAVAGKDRSIWKYMLYGEPITVKGMQNWVKDILNRRDGGDENPFVVVHKPSGNVIGSTRYMEMKPEYKRLEIGGTWYAVEYHHTRVNTECKYLLLKYAFEVLGCIRVQFKTDLRNTRSQKAIERLGAQKEGVLRNHMITPEGLGRDSVFYSILDSEWPKVKGFLEKKLSGFE
jgi:RimJ/RimL family protein N-acetyltransferase